MKIEVDLKYNMILKEVYNPIILESADKESITICMRDTGFEVMYMGNMYEFKNGKVPQTKLIEDIKPCPFCNEKPKGPEAADEGWWIECESCEIIMEDNSKRNLIALWNKRA